MKDIKPQIALEKMMELYEDLETLLKGYDDINLDTQLSKSYKDFNDSFEIVQEALEELKPNSLHDSQAISPSVLEKYDKLKKAHDYYYDLASDNAMEICKLRKELFITDKALDKACLYLSIDRPKISDKQWKEDLLKESEKDNETK